MAAVRLDERARTLSALLAATDWPEREQQPKPHGVHPQANALRRHAETFRDHPAVAYLQRAFETATRNPAPYFGLALNVSWPDCEPTAGAEAYAAALPGIEPPELGAQLRVFYADAGLAAFWNEQAAAWEEAAAAIRAHIDGVDFSSFLGALFGAAPHELICVPNPLYPSQIGIGVCSPDTISCLLHPRRAVGESPPWPYAADREYVLRMIVHTACEALLPAFLAEHSEPVRLAGASASRFPFDDKFRNRYPEWEQQLSQLITLAATALFLDEIDPGAGHSFTLFEQRASGLRFLPIVVLTLRGYLEQQRAGAYQHIAEYLPRFTTDMQTMLSKFEAP